MTTNALKNKRNILYIKFKISGIQNESVALLTLHGACIETVTDKKKNYFWLPKLLNAELTCGFINPHVSSAFVTGTQCGKKKIG